MGEWIIGRLQDIKLKRSRLVPQAAHPVIQQDFYFAVPAAWLNLNGGNDDELAHTNLACEGLTMSQSTADRKERAVSADSMLRRLWQPSSV